MTPLAVITPSYAGDYELCVDLNRSVLAFSPDPVHHHIIVPRRDMALFRQLAGPRTRVHDEAEFLPRALVPLPRVNLSINLRRPYPPVRGWIIQQIRKLAAAAELDAEVAVMVDSDVQFCRPFTVDTFAPGGQVRFYRRPEGVDGQMARHVIWHRVSREMLGLPAAEPPHHDYVSSLLAWDTSVLRSMLRRVEAVTHRPWATAVGAQLHFSEFTLYGVYVDEAAGAPANGPASDDPLCHTYWEDTPLDEQGIDRFLGGIKPDDVAVMVSAKSHTPLEVRRAALAGLSLAP